MKASLIISVYKNINALELILLSCEKQSFTDFEIIVAEDNDSAEMTEFIAKYRSNSKLKIKHIFQKDEGFLKNSALNKSIVISESDYVIFIDGDCILHKHFIGQHVKNQETGTCLFGRRVMISKKLTASIYATKSLNKLNLFQLLFSGSKRVEDGFYLPFMKSRIQTKSAIWGCNWSTSKLNLKGVNGFDEDYNRPGFGEDIDIEYRLLGVGMVLKSLKFKAVQYHLDHSLNYEGTKKMEEIFVRKKKEGNTFCIRGLNQYLG